MYKINFKNIYKVGLINLTIMSILLFILNFVDPDKINLLMFLIVFFLIYCCVFLGFVLIHDLYFLFLAYFYDYKKNKTNYKDLFLLFSIAFLPVYLIGNKTIGHINSYEVILILITIFLMNFYIKKH